MKSIHFCTPNLLKFLNTLEVGDEFTTIRTGWITHLYPGNIVKVNQFQKDTDDIFLFNAMVQDVYFLKFSKLKESMSINEQEEIDRYGRKFHDEHYFFKIKFVKIK